jgi:hypothetical protein
MGTGVSTAIIAYRRAEGVMDAVWAAADEAAAALHGEPRETAGRVLRTCRALDAGTRLLMCATVDAPDYKARDAAATRVTHAGTVLRLSRDLTHARGDARKSIGVVVAADDVTIDGAGHAISGFAFGLVVVPGRRNVAIRNLRVTGAALGGIMALCVDGVTLTNVVVVDGGADMGVCCLACTDVTAVDCAVRALHHTPASALSSSGFHARYCRRVRFQRCAVTDLRCEAGGCCGFITLGCMDVDFAACAVNGLASGRIVRQALGHTCSAVFPFLSANVRVRGVRVRNVAGSCDDAHGISVFACPGRVSIAACDIHDVSTGSVYGPAPGSGAKATGVEVCVALSVRLCDVRVRTVVASRPQDRQCAGFAVGTCAGVLLVRCSASDIRCVNGYPPGADPGTEPLPRGVAFGWAPDVRRRFIGVADHTRLIACSAADCDIGFDLFNHRGADLRECIGTRCRQAVFHDDAHEVRRASCSMCSECFIAGKVVIHNEGGANRVHADGADDV